MRWSWRGRDVAGDRQLAAYAVTDGGADAGGGVQDAGSIAVGSGRGCGRGCRVTWCRRR